MYKDVSGVGFFFPGGKRKRGGHVNGVPTWALPIPSSSLLYSLTVSIFFNSLLKLNPDY